MAVDPGTVQHMSQVISQVVGPAFLLGAVASFIGMLFVRMDQIAGQLRLLRYPPNDDHHPDLFQRPELLKRRLRWLHKAVLLATASGIITTIQIIGSFAEAFFDFQHQWGTAILFTVSLSFFCSSLILLGIDVFHSIKEFDDY